jgi:hypothetical protein
MLDHGGQEPAQSGADESAGVAQAILEVVGGRHFGSKKNEVAPNPSRLWRVKNFREAVEGPAPNACG